MIYFYIRNVLYLVMPGECYCFTVMLLGIFSEPVRLILFILMDFPIHIDTIRVELSTSFLKRSQVEISR